MILPKNTIQVSANGREWVGTTKLKDNQIRYARDKDSNYFRVKKVDEGANRSVHRFASVTKAHVVSMGKSRIFK